MKVWITKYALTKGIYQEDAEICDEEMIRVKQVQYFHFGEWHMEKDKAIQKAEEMRIKKLQSLDKQIKKISAMKFE